MNIPRAIEDPVKSQYEQWVYPEPIANLSDPHVRAIRDAGDPDMLGHAYWPDRPVPRRLNILVAGCGTNAAARYAFHHPESTVIGVDISEASLAHERHLKTQHRLGNLTLHNCRVEQVEELGLTFDLIDSTGVLHHLPEPGRGIRSLANVLRPDGVIFLMLYGAYGRTGVYMMQRLLRLLRVGQSPADVEFTKQVLGTLKADHIARDYVARARDLRFDAGIVDTFLHPQDRAYTVSECIEFLKTANLALQGWSFRYFYNPEWQIPRDSPLFDRIQKLPDHERWQAMELFHGRIGTHGFYACHQARDPSSYRIDFDRPDFMAMRPVLRLDVVRRDDPDGSLSVECPHFPKISLRDSVAALLRCIDNRRSVQGCFEAAGLHAGTEEIAANFCRDTFRDFWRLGAVDLVFPGVPASCPSS